MMERFCAKHLYSIDPELSNEVLDVIESYTDSLEYENSRLVSGINSDRRKSKNAWIDPNNWISAIAYNAIINANLQYFNYDIGNIWESVQVTVYNEDHSHYEWHCDNVDVREVQSIPTERKLSCSFLLSDPDDYDGGELQFNLSHNKFFKSVKPKRGIIYVFPSWIPHRVRPVTRGVRKSIVAWMSGPLFK